MSDARCYTEMVKTFLNDRDRQMFEWALGSLINGGTPYTFVFVGPAMTGKTTLTGIVRRVYQTQTAYPRPKVMAQTGDHVVYYPETFSFVEHNNPDAPLFLVDGKHDGDCLTVHMTGRVFPIEKFRELNSGVNHELPQIASHCTSVYRALGANHYLQENHR